MQSLSNGGETCPDRRYWGKVGMMSGGTCSGDHIPLSTGVTSSTVLSNDSRLPSDTINHEWFDIQAHNMCTVRVALVAPLFAYFRIRKFPYYATLSSSCWGDPVWKKSKYPTFHIGSGWNLVGSYDCSSRKYALIHGVGFLILRHHFKICICNAFIA